MTAAALTRRRRWLVRGLVALASLVLLLSVLAVWVAREALDTDTYANTSSELLQQPEVQSALSNYLVDQLYANVDVEAQIQQKLPPQAQGLAGPAAALLRDYAVRAAERAFQSERVQQLWITANRAAHAQLVVVINGGGDKVSTTGGDVVLNTSGMLQQLADRLNITLPTALAGGRIVILHSDQLSTAQTIAHWLKVAAWVLPFLALALYALAVYLSPGRRREAVRACGVGIFVAGVLLLIARNVTGGVLVDSLTTLPQYRSAANAAWGVITADLADATRTVIAVGFIAVLWAWLAGSGRRATALRHGMAATARDHAAYLWGGFTALVLLLIWWEPTHAFRRTVPALVLIALAALGLEALRRQTLSEFPDAPAGQLGAGLRERWAARGRQAPQPAAAPKVEQLERLAALHSSGELNDEEYAALKRDLVS